MKPPTYSSTSWHPTTSLFSSYPLNPWPYCYQTGDFQLENPFHCNPLKSWSLFYPVFLVSTSSSSPNYFEPALKIFHKPMPVRIFTTPCCIWFQSNPPSPPWHTDYTSWTTRQTQHLDPPWRWRLVYWPLHATLPLLPQPHQRNFFLTHHQHIIQTSFADAAITDTK